MIVALMVLGSVRDLTLCSPYDQTSQCLFGALSGKHAMNKQLLNSY